MKIELKSDSEFDNLVTEHEFILLDFYGDWCSPCKMMNPVIESLDEEYGNKLQIIKVDVDLNLNVNNQFHIKTIPTFIVLKNNEMIYRHSGAAPKSFFVEKLSSLID